ncbi:dethiobiotin synthase [Aestuariirhabdus litorea]|uniref:ATP-dependent dethiobiotin synthetase BioD n=1 Tax=Aestuariirhabdus litorea TaxID=2528527 RepID=A0A3P3VN82_9GAMM|nr:dethiobiotin synthase [Aestuariirhabdus litorea]RRJ83169.1 dethiobiotin synthase [Aestuariirhabdus litorea]RWW93326.1 dethiobiotin synthase [Endozoicomonadaceae bacterium GTF-13]
MQRRQFFIAGTDTDTGKTLVACALLEAAKSQGLSTLALKPVAAGCEETAEGLRNSDALLLQQHMTLPLPYEQINPVALRSAIAPHIAARQEERRLSVDRLVGLCRGALMQRADLKLVEGAGGWRVPLNERETLSGVPVALNLPVILVVGMKLGCLNHALLTVEAIRRDGLPLAGWVANQVDPQMSCFDDNLESLRVRLGAPLLGVIPHLSQPTAELAAQYLDLTPVL